MGFYGNGSHRQWQDTCTEASPPQDVFVSRLCQLWEASAEEVHRATGVPIAVCRLGVVLGRDGGILPQLLRPIRFGVGRIGSGQQPMAWIHMDDVVAPSATSANSPSMPPGASGTSPPPERTTQLDFAQTAARVLHRKLWLSLPGGLMRRILGEQADLVLDGQHVQPAHLLDDGYTFQYPTLAAALDNLTGRA